MKWVLCVLSGAVIFFLCACQKTHDEAFLVKKPQLVLAAVYNTQLGLEYLKQGNEVRAKRKLSLALQQDPKSPVAHSAMAYFLEQSKEIDKADLYYKKAIFLAGGTGASLNNYGAFLCRQGHYQEAENYFLKAVDDMHYDSPAGAYENAGLCFLAEGDDVKARIYFVKALEHGPTRANSLYQLLKICEKKADMHSAMDYLKLYYHSTEKDPNVREISMRIMAKAKLDKQIA